MAAPASWRHFERRANASIQNIYPISRDYKGLQCLTALNGRYVFVGEFRRVSNRALATR